MPALSKKGPRMSRKKRIFFDKEKT